jgi:predicted nucleotidyltransferase component of viral defense system
MNVRELADFYLAGGTALSLYYGHRRSIDLDLFSTTDFDTQVILQALSDIFPEFVYGHPNNKVGIFSFIENIKVDLIKYHHYHLIDTPVIEDGIRLMGIPDIAAMKVSAILKRGVKKDFWDISELLVHYKVADLINFYNQKFHSQQLLISIPQALTYFADAEDSEEPVSLKGQTWEQVKKHIKNSINEFLR